jgi:Helicase HerA-like C-terminal
VVDRVLHLGHGFSLPAEQFIETKFGVIGQSGRGKTGLVRRTLEECHRVHLPFIVMDPSGILWGLRSSFDGKGPGLPILVIGGDHGDLPLVRTAGADVARAVVAANVSCVIDLSNESKATYRQFAKDFAETLFAINDSPRFLVLDEAPELVPQSLSGRPDLAATFDAIERLVRQGRNKGIGVMLVSQRAATISKDVLTQCGSLFVFGLVGTPDRKALREWVQAYGSEDQLREFEEGLASLEVRECWFWSPSEFKVFRKIRVLDFHTFHPDRTHLRRIGMLAQKAVTEDVTGIVSKLGAQMEKLAKEKADVAELPRLRRQVTELTRRLEDAPTATKTVEKPVVDQKAVDRAVKRVEEKYAPFLKRLNAYSGHLQDTASRLDVILTTAPPSEAMAAAGVEGWREPLPVPSRAVPAVIERPRREPENGSETGRLTGGAKRMWAALLAAYPTSLTRSDLGVLGEIAPNSGTFSDYLSLLRRNGLIEELSDGTIQSSPDGRAKWDGPAPSPWDRSQRVASASARVSGGSRRMLQALVNVYPEEMSREQLGQEANIASGSGTFSDYLSQLRRLGFITTSTGMARAADVLCRGD